MRATVHNVHHERMQEGDVYIGRAGRGQTGYFGNPFRLERESDREEVLEQFTAYAIDRICTDTSYAERVKALHGKRLFCFCAPKACHGDVLSALAAALQEGN